MADLLTKVGGLAITAFHGGQARGPCLQFDIVAGPGYDYATLSGDDVSHLVSHLACWLSKNFGEEWRCELDGRFPLGGGSR